MTTVATGVPRGWTRGAEDHLQVDLDGTPTVRYPIMWDATIRMTAWASSPTDAKALAGLAQGLLAEHGGGSDGIARTRPLTGVLLADDPDSGAFLASTTTRVTVRADDVAGAWVPVDAERAVIDYLAPLLADESS